MVPGKFAMLLWVVCLLVCTGCGRDQLIGTVVSAEQAMLKDGTRYHAATIVTIKTRNGNTVTFADKRKNRNWQEGEEKVVELSDECNDIGNYPLVRSVQEVKGKVIDAEQDNVQIAPTLAIEVDPNNPKDGPRDAAIRKIVQEELAVAKRIELLERRLATVENATEDNADD